jgi:bifunctional non-homologous end joining protein LigD
LTLSNLDKVLYPKTGFTKGDLITYYLEVAQAMLPHLADRPLTLKRYPDGISGKFFYEKHVPSHTPEWVRRVVVPRRVRDTRGETIEYAVVDELATLIWAANLATIEFHVPMWRGEPLNPEPMADWMVFDLDPGPSVTLVECCQVALIIEERLLAEGLSAMPKTSGKKGMQLYVPLSPVRPSREVIDYAHQLSREVEEQHNDLVVTNMRKELRTSRVLIDWSQNNAAKTTVAPYSLRAEAEPSASTPVTWQEVEGCATSGDSSALVFLAPQVIERVRSLGDLMAGPA